MKASDLLPKTTKESPIYCNLNHNIGSRTIAIYGQSPCACRRLLGSHQNGRGVNSKLADRLDMMVAVALVQILQGFA